MQTLSVTPSGVTERVQPAKKEAHHTIRGCCTECRAAAPVIIIKLFSYASAVMAATASTMAPSTMR